MKQVAQNYRKGTVTLEDVSEPSCRRGGVLVATEFSAVSMGTEGMKVREGKLSYVGMAKARPDQVKKVLSTLQQQGITATYKKVMNRLDSLTPLGYSIAGRVIEVGAGVSDIRVGQRVACGGAGYANHAAINFVPRNLCVPIPDGVPSEYASFATIGSIAMQGYRQSDMQLGESACVIGLGLIGQLLVQILNAAGVTVIGVDLQEKRLQQGLKGGAKSTFSPDDSGLQAAVDRATGGRGMDCIFITAGGASNRPIELAVELARDRARVIDIGKTKLDLSWNDFYDKELDLRFSRSYGPGRYDPNYEERGVDYPASYVRWTENRNMESFLGLLDSAAVDLSGIISEVLDFDDAEAVYSSLAMNNDALGLVFRHAETNDIARTTELAELGSLAEQQNGASAEGGRVGVLGAGNYSSTMLLPVLANDERISLVAVGTASSLSAKNASKRFAFERSTTDHREVIGADDIGSVLIATRHATHVDLVCAALEADKNVFVEKPLAIDRDGLRRVIDTLITTSNHRLVVGFNRRYAPLIRRMRDIVKDQPVSLLYRVQAGPLEQNSWYLDAEQGGRFIGEAGHFFDSMNYLVGAKPIAVSAQSLNPEQRLADDPDNITATVEYEDGSVACLMYLTQGSPRVGKEYIEVHGSGTTAVIEDFRALTVFRGSKRERAKAKAVDKGQRQQLQEWATAISTGAPMPIRLDEVISSTALTLAAAESTRTNKRIALADFLGS